MIVVCGPSGSGKSTLIKCVNALEPFQKGVITVDGISVGAPKTNLPKLRARVGMVFQHFELFPHLTIIDNLTLAQIKVLNRNKEEASVRGMKLLDRVGLTTQAAKFPGQLSGGQQQRVAIARALSMDPICMLFDEPTSALDPEMINEVLDVMVQLAKEGMTMMVVTHEMGFARKVANRVIFMDNGEIVEDAAKDDFFGQPRSERAQLFLSKILHTLAVAASRARAQQSARRKCREFAGVIAKRPRRLESRLRCACDCTSRPMNIRHKAWSDASSVLGAVMVATGLGASGIAAAQTAERAESQGAANVGKDARYRSHRNRDRPDAMPFAYLDENKQPIGYGIDICREIVRLMERELKRPLRIAFVEVSAKTRFEIVNSRQSRHGMRHDDQRSTTAQDHRLLDAISVFGSALSGSHRFQVARHQDLEAGASRSSPARIPSRCSSRRSTAACCPVP